MLSENRLMPVRPVCRVEATERVPSKAYDEQIKMLSSAGRFDAAALDEIAGTQNINPVLLKAARSIGATKCQIFHKIVFPFMIPSQFTRMRLGMSATVTGVTFAELYASQRGVGFYTRQFSDVS